MPQTWKDAVIQVLYKKKDRAKSGNCRGISLAAQAGKVLLTLVVRHLGSYFKDENLLPEGQCGCQFGISTVGMMFAARLLQELDRR